MMEMGELVLLFYIIIFVLWNFTNATVYSKYNNILYEMQNASDSTIKTILEKAGLGGVYDFVNTILNFIKLLFTLIIDFITFPLNFPFPINLILLLLLVMVIITIISKIVSSLPLPI